jgi:hypothetical protein
MLRARVERDGDADSEQAISLHRRHFVEQVNGTHRSLVTCAMFGEDVFGDRRDVIGPRKATRQHAS